MKKTMRYTDLSAFSRSYGELIKTETKTIHTIEGFQAYAILDIFEYGSTFFVAAVFKTFLPSAIVWYSRSPSL
jgi:hypothetical protein